MCHNDSTHFFNPGYRSYTQLYLAMDKLGTDIGNMGGIGSDDNNDNDNEEAGPVSIP